MTTLAGGLAFTIGTLDPYDAATAGAVAVLDHVHDPLRWRDPATGRLAGGLLMGDARRTGERCYEIDLTPGLRFADGNPVTAEDVASSIRTMLDAQSAKGRLLGGALSSVRDAAAAAAGTVRLDTAGPVPLIDERLSVVRVIAQSDLVAGDARAIASGTGPFRLRTFDQRRAVLVPVEHYPGSSSRTEIELDSCVDPNERVERLLAGRYLAIEDPPPFASGRIRSAGLRLDDRPSQNMMWLMFNCGHPTLSDVRVRRAIVHAIDRDALSAASGSGALQPADSLLPRWHPDHADCPDSPRFDPDLAGSLLAASGHAGGLHLRLAVSSASWVAAHSERILRQLSTVGVEVEMTIAHTADLFSQAVPAGDFDLLLASGDPSVYGVDGEFILRWYLAGTWIRDYCQLRDPAVDNLESLLDAAAVEERIPRRRDLLAAVQRIAAHLVPMAVLGHRRQPTAWSPALSGFAPSRTTGRSLRLS